MNKLKHAFNEAITEYLPQFFSKAVVVKLLAIILITGVITEINNITIQNETLNNVIRLTGCLLTLYIIISRDVYMNLYSYKQDLQRCKNAIIKIQGKFKF